MTRSPVPASHLVYSVIYDRKEAPGGCAHAIAGTPTAVKYSTTCSAGAVHVTFRDTRRESHDDTRTWGAKEWLGHPSGEGFHPCTIVAAGLIVKPEKRDGARDLTIRVEFMGSRSATPLRFTIAPENLADDAGEIDLDVRWMANLVSVRVNGADTPLEFERL